VKRRPASLWRGPRAAIVLAALAAALGGVAAVQAAPLVPVGDAEVIEVLPAAGRVRAEERRARRALAHRPDDAAQALRLARADLERSRSTGDPRHAGLALAALRHWSDPAAAPAEVLLLQATLDQHLHEFDASAAKLEQLVRRQPRQAQAWLTLATVRRVQGRYADSDAACRGLDSAGASLHAAACLAENDGLRGRFETARVALQRAAGTAQLDPATRGWLLTTLAELEQRTGAAERAEAAWRAALRAAADGYTVLGYADFLIVQERAADARELLADQPASDAVVLRRAQAGDAAAVREIRARFAQAAQRPDAALTHGREQAMFALHVEHDARRAVELARLNLQRQREPVDLRLLAESARAAGDVAALAEATRLATAQGLVDVRWSPASIGGRP
jgi:hypothetical protein